MTTRAKFHCYSVTQYPGGAADVKLGVIYDPHGNEEDRNFTKATPSGEINMRIDNPAAAVQFAPGKSYYVDFNEVPADKV